jgi:hypothetical protein
MLHFNHRDLEKWLRRRSKIFSASEMCMTDDDLIQTVGFRSGKAENI